MQGFNIAFSVGGYEYVVLPGAPIPHEPEVTPMLLGKDFYVELRDEKNGWWVGSCDTYEQALLIVGADLIRHASQMHEMIEADGPHTSMQYDAAYAEVAGGKSDEEGDIFSDEEVLAIARKHRLTPAETAQLVSASADAMGSPS